MTLYAEIDTDDNQKIVIDQFEWRFKDLLKSLPSSKYKDDKWYFNLSWQMCLALKYTFKEHLEVGPNLKAWADNKYKTSILPAYNLRTAPDAEGYPQLFPHQRADVQFLSAAGRAILANGMGSGKALAVSEPVLTPMGWTTMGQVQVGDELVGKDGKPVTVIGAYPQGTRDIYKVSFKDGAFVLADKNHLWRVTPVKSGHSRVLTTGDLMDVGLTQDGTNNLKWKIPMVDPVEFEKRDLQLSPYIMGAILGDGAISSKSITLTSADQGIIARVNSELPAEMSMKRVGKSEYAYLFSNTGTHKNNRVKDALVYYGLFGLTSASKTIPADYMYSSVKDRVALLQGLMDTDGTIGTGGNVSYCTVSYQLACDVRELVQSLGGTAVWNYHKRPKLGNYDPIVLTIRMPDSISPFHLERMQARVQKATKYPLSRFVSRIEFSHREAAKCIAVDAEDMLFVTRDYVVTHNSQSAFSTVRYLFEQGKDVFPVMIACPNSTKGSWKREIEKVWPGLTVHIVDGTATKRRKILSEPGHVYIINWEAIRGHSRLAPFGSIALKKCPEHKGLDDKVKPAACEVHEKELNTINFKTVIGDEIHRIKDPASKMSRAFKAATGDAEYRFALSGTPIASSPDDLYSVLNWLYPEAYPSKSKYLDRFCQTHFNAWGATVVVGIKKEMEAEFFAGLDPILRRMPKEAILPFLPPVIRERRDVEMGAKQKKAYEQMRDQMIAQLGDNILHTTSPLVKMTRLIQFASAYADVEIKDVYNKKKGVVEKKALVTLADPSCKLDAFMDDIEGFGDESVIVFAPSVQLIRMLSARLEKLKIPHGLITGDQDSVEREKHMANFQDGKTKFILCTIQAGGTGITLTRAKIMVYLGRSWSMIDNLQSEARGHRIGSEIHDHVMIIDYVTAGTVEEEVFRAIEQKTNNLEQILRDKILMQKVMENKPIEIEVEPFDIDKARTEKSEYDEE